MRGKLLAAVVDRLLEVLRAIVASRLLIVLALASEVLFVGSCVAALVVVASVGLVSLGMASGTVAASARTVAVASLAVLTAGRGRG